MKFLLPLILLPLILCHNDFVPWSFGLTWNKIVYTGPGSAAMDLAFRAARSDQINKVYQNPMMPSQIPRAQQSGLHTQIEAVYVEANCVGISNAPGTANFDFVAVGKCVPKPLGKRVLYRVAEDKTPDAKSNKISAWKIRDVGLYEIVLG
ncbi:hypothetical protein PRIPAC_88352 [Pristionchus pacificus]|uniref:Uncharacterized protein n=1 Tax=Pristionchus pacificus TaxID=54126 RepID=A0A2A6B7S8_PRIPA|nr:hypothetical protein PRIPAC_88352 [Pristionchus pacificus]|eukprot:PDM61928.1 hypothetical protein PRIPAC_51370 [Pristionchus pacificus]